MNRLEEKLIEVFRTSLSLDQDDTSIRNLKRAEQPQWNSMSHLNLILAAEEHFHISIPEEKGAAIASFSDMAALIQTLLPSS